jgi:hypothetical protein
MKNEIVKNFISRVKNNRFESNIIYTINQMWSKDMKRLLLLSSIIFCLLLSSASALQEVAGPIVISVVPGGTNSSSKYGLINDGNETIVVSLRAEGDVAKYLSFPSNVSLEPKKIVYINITATLPLPFEYNGGNITGSLYALQEGTPGQVQINIQMMKSVTIVPYEVKKQTSFVAYLYIAIVVLIALSVIVFALIRLKKKEVKKENEDKNSNNRSNTFFDKSS